MKQIRNRQNRKQVCTKIKYKQETNPCFASGNLLLRKYCSFEKVKCFSCGKTEYEKADCEINFCFKMKENRGNKSFKENVNVRMWKFVNGKINTI